MAGESEACGPSAYLPLGWKTGQNPTLVSHSALLVMTVFSICLSPMSLILSWNQTGDGEKLVLFKHNPANTVWYYLWLGLPRGHSNKESACLCRRHRRHGFDHWVRKIPWRRKWWPSPIFLPGKSHGQRNLVGYSPCGRKELDTTERHLLLLTFLYYSERP